MQFIIKSANFTLLQRIYHDSEVTGPPPSGLCRQSGCPLRGARGQSPGPKRSVIEQLARGPGLPHLHQAQSVGVGELPQPFHGGCADHFVEYL